MMKLYMPWNMHIVLLYFCLVAVIVWVINGFMWDIYPYSDVLSYPGYIQEPYWLSVGLPEKSRVTWQLCISFG